MQCGGLLVCCLVHTLMRILPPEPSCEQIAAVARRKCLLPENCGGHGVQESAGTGAVGALVRDAVHAADVAPMGAGAVVEPQQLSGGVSSLADAPDAAQLVKTAAAHALWDASELLDPNALLEVTSLPLPDPPQPSPPHNQIHPSFHARCVP